MALRLLKGGDGTGDEFARAIFLAYFNGEPWIAEIGVHKDDQSLRPVVERFGPPGITTTIFSGSERVWKQHFPFPPEIPQSLQEASDVIERYIQLCVDDPDCEDIGGHIHIGKLTPSGFTWIHPPKAGVPYGR
jgi:hypothetical protein